MKSIYLTFAALTIKYTDDNGNTPKVSEIRKAFNFKSNNSVTGHLRSLEKKGYIEQPTKIHGIILIGKQRNKLELKDYEHPFYCDNHESYRWESWEDFYSEWKNADPDLNLILRWDIQYDDEDNNEWYLIIIAILQRKAIIVQHLIYNFENDLEEIEKYLNEKWNHLKKLWSPFVTEETINKEVCDE